MNVLQRRRQRGVSLIEAVVAMAIMAFGMLGVLGMQSTLRSNSDISKQRSEAVRIAQQRIENDRTFSVLATDPLGLSRAYDDIVDTSAAPENFTPPGTNTTFTLTKKSVAFPALVADLDKLAAYKRLQAEVTWIDRNNEQQRVRVNTMVSATSPMIAAALSTPAIGGAVQSTRGRNPTIPVAAIDQGDGTSRFRPPGGAVGLRWVFNNSSGFITQICNPVCADVNARLLAGWVRFSTRRNGIQPSALDAELPSSASRSIDVYVDTTVPNGRTSCYIDDTSDATAVAYFCAMRLAVDAALPVGSPFADIQIWSGRTTVDGLNLANDINDDNEDHFKVCRYTTTRAHTVVPFPPVPNPAIRNQDHPLDYVRVDTNLVGQNFLVIRAGDDSGTAYFCPADDAVGTPDLFTNTWYHQPSS